MSFGSRRRRLNEEEADGNLEVTPLLGLFMALIPFLVFAAVLYKVNVVEVGISKPVAQATKSSKKPFNLSLVLSEKTAVLSLNDKVIDRISAKEDVSDWIADVRKSLVKLKRRHPGEYRIRIEPKGSRITLQTLMAFMDGARNLKDEDGEILHRDEKGKPIKLKYLFPNVVLKGVYS